MHQGSQEFSQEGYENEEMQFSNLNLNKKIIVLIFLDSFNNKTTRSSGIFQLLISNKLLAKRITYLLC